MIIELEYKVQPVLYRNYDLMLILYSDVADTGRKKLVAKSGTKCFFSCAINVFVHGYLTNKE